MFQSRRQKGLFKSFINIKHNRANGAIGDCLIYLEDEISFIKMRI
jgi:hypothetical protein